MSWGQLTPVSLEAPQAATDSPPTYFTNIGNSQWHPRTASTSAFTFNAPPTRAIQPSGFISEYKWLRPELQTTPAPEEDAASSSSSYTWVSTSDGTGKWETDSEFDNVDDHIHSIIGSKSLSLGKYFTSLVKKYLPGRKNLKPKPVKKSSTNPKEAKKKKAAAKLAKEEEKQKAVKLKREKGEKDKVMRLEKKKKRDGEKTVRDAEKKRVAEEKKKERETHQADLKAKAARHKADAAKSPPSPKKKSLGGKLVGKAGGSLKNAAAAAKDSAVASVKETAVNAKDSAVAAGKQAVVDAKDSAVAATSAALAPQE
jgi:hypothetical protein